eukprot:TRINITY_DN9988_c0_g1_i19.p1 TRINITY_DN9988_c0_g1~~TRINITY_DN9988_c0_g1_i19.p1  ORF type:complete len:257 (+),score=2.46 TRINITY_DN9988_c0_g1_i19:180-950(+)
MYTYQNTPQKLKSIQKELAQSVLSQMTRGIEIYLKTYRDKTPILPKSFIRKENVYVKIPEFYSSQRQYWQQTGVSSNSNELEMQVFQKIADDIINQPYVDDNRMQLDSYQNVIYRPNHDVTHAIRQVFYLDTVINYLIQNQIEPSQGPWLSFLKIFTSEELACLRLAAFMYRAGRTNEKGSSTDITALERSANLFKIVASQLEFAQELIKSASALMKQYIPPRSSLERYDSTGFSSDKHGKHAANEKSHKAQTFKR